MKNNEISIIKVESDQLEEAARCHISAFQSSIASRLGISYIRKRLEWYIVSEDRFLLGAKHEDEIIGYIGGAKGAGSTSGMLQHAFWQGVASILARPYLIFDLSLFRYVGLISKNIKKRLMSRQSTTELSRTKISTSRDDLSIGLIVVGVSPNHRREGIGSILLEAFYDKCKELGARYGHLSVKTSNTNAIEAYKKNGWIVIDSNENSTSMRVEIV